MKSGELGKMLDIIPGVDPKSTYRSSYSLQNVGQIRYRSIEWSEPTTGEDCGLRATNDEIYAQLEWCEPTVDGKRGI